jgi:hypothetical protein
LIAQACDPNAVGAWECQHCFQCPQLRLGWFKQQGFLVQGCNKLAFAQFGLAAWFGRYFRKCISQIACLMIWKIGIKPFTALKPRQKPHYNLAIYCISEQVWRSFIGPALLTLNCVSALPLLVQW